MNDWPQWLDADSNSWQYLSEEEETTSLALHVKHCRKAEQDQYCKICLEY